MGDSDFEETGKVPAPGTPMVARQQYSRDRSGEGRFIFCAIRLEAKLPARVSKFYVTLLFWY